MFQADHFVHFFAIPPVNETFFRHVAQFTVLLNNVLHSRIVLHDVLQRKQKPSNCDMLPFR